MKKNLFKSLLLTVVLCLSSIGIYAQLTTTANVGVTARLAKQLIIEKITDVDFGGIYIPTSGLTTVELDHASNVTFKAGTVVTALYSENLQSSGSIIISAGQAYRVTVTYPSTMNITNTDGAQIAYRPQLFHVDGTDYISGTQFTLQLNGDLEVGSYNKMFMIGGELDVPSSSDPGTYTGILTVTATWQ